MILTMFCVRDRATDQFGTPMFLVTAGQAIRSFSDEVNRKAADNQIAAHPEDFDLYCLGTWNSSTGVFDSKVPEQIAIGKNLLVNKEV